VSGVGIQKAGYRANTCKGGGKISVWGPRERGGEGGGVTVMPFKLIGPDKSQSGGRTYD